MKREENPFFRLNQIHVYSYRDLPRLLMEWVDEDNQWRIVKVESREFDGEHRQHLTLTHVWGDQGETDHADWEFVDFKDPDERRRAVEWAVEVMDDMEVQRQPGRWSDRHAKHGEVP